MSDSDSRHSLRGFALLWSQIVLYFLFGAFYAFSKAGRPQWPDLAQAEVEKVETYFMKNRRRRAKVPEAIVVVNALGTAVDCNNTFARLYQTPAGILVGQELSGFAPEIAAVLERDAQLVDDVVMTVGDQSFSLAVEPFAEDSGSGNIPRDLGGEKEREKNADRIIRLRGLRWDEVA